MTNTEDTITPTFKFNFEHISNQEILRQFERNKITASNRKKIEATMVVWIQNRGETLGVKFIYPDIMSKINAYVEYYLSGNETILYTENQVFPRKIEKNLEPETNPKHEETNLMKESAIKENFSHSSDINAYHLSKRERLIESIIRKAFQNPNLVIRNKINIHRGSLTYHSIPFTRFFEIVFTFLFMYGIYYISEGKFGGTINIVGIISSSALLFILIIISLIIPTKNVIWDALLFDLEGAHYLYKKNSGEFTRRTIPGIKIKNIFVKFKKRSEAISSTVSYNKMKTTYRIHEGYDVFVETYRITYKFAFVSKSTNFVDSIQKFYPTKLEGTQTKKKINLVIYFLMVIGIILVFI